MSVAHPGWFGPPDRRLFGWLHTPSDLQTRGGVVLCPPLTANYYASHEAYRYLADQLAGAGLAALRFDYFGTGDSDGDPSDVTAVARWLDDIRCGIDHLRRAGASAVGVAGMRMGATLAAAALDGGHGPSDFLVLWDPCLTGRSFMREDTLLMQQDPWSGLQPETFAKGSQQLVGFDFPDELVAELGRLGLPPEPPPVSRVLVLTRTGTLPTRLDRWKDVRSIEVAEAEGQGALLEVPLHEVAVPKTAIGRIVGWCGKATPTTANPVTSFLDDFTAVARGHGGEVRETARLVGEHDLFAVRTEDGGAAPRLDVLFLNSGLQPHIGPHRFYVELARRLATDGIRSTRIDMSGIGDSPPRPLHESRIIRSPNAFDDMSLALKEFTDPSTPVALVGLCSGGYHALEGAFLAEVRGVCAVHITLNFGRGTWRAEETPDDPRRRIWIPDRPWLDYLNGFRWPRALIRRLPSVVWKLLDHLELQSDPTRQVQTLAQQGTDVLLIPEYRVLAGPRLKELSRFKNKNMTIVTSSADHSIVDHYHRQIISDIVRNHLLRWRRAGTAP